MEIQKLIEATDTAIKAIYEDPEGVLRALGPDKALQLLKKLSVSPELEAQFKDCKLMKLIESGVKYTTGHIPTKEELHEGKIVGAVVNGKYVEITEEESDHE